MKYFTTLLLLFCLTIAETNSQVVAQVKSPEIMINTEILKTESHVNGLKIAITHTQPHIRSYDYPVLFLHGSSFPSALAFNFRIEGKSWMEDLSEKGYDVYALDFLGYGNSDRYPEMKSGSSIGKPLGTALDVYLDVDKAVDFVLGKTGKDKVYLIGHSWGGSVAALYATKFSNKISKLVLFAGVTARNETTTLENVQTAYEEMTPTQRVNSMKNLTPKDNESVMEKEVFETWGNIWLQSDEIAIKTNSDKVRFPSGPSQDIEVMKHNRSYFDPKEIKAPTLLIRGEWDKYPNAEDADLLFRNLTNAVSKKYVMIERGTHVMHLEKSREKLYDEVLFFLQKKRK